MNDQFGRIIWKLYYASPAHQGIVRQELTFMAKIIKYLNNMIVTTASMNTVLSNMILWFMT